jgi:hypothetical protein
MRDDNNKAGGIIETQIEGERGWWWYGEEEH